MQSEQYLISVIVPVYNDESHIIQCATSILNQRYGNLELIIVEDGSDDCTPELCDVIQSWDDRVTVIHKENGGPSAARNAGLLACRGDWIHFVDSDDWIEQDLYALIVPQIQHSNADIAYFGWVFDAKKPAYQSINGRNGVGGTYDLMHDMLLQVGPAEDNRSYSNYIWNKLFKRELLFNAEAPLLFDESIDVAEDFVWLLDVVPRARRGVFDSTAYYHYVLNNESVTKAESRRVSSWLKSQEIHMAALEWLKEEGYEELYEVHKRSCVNFFTQSFKQAAKRGDQVGASKMFANIQEIGDGDMPEQLVKDLAILQDIFPKFKKQQADLSHKSVKLFVKCRGKAVKVAKQALKTDTAAKFKETKAGEATKQVIKKLRQG